MKQTALPVIYVVSQYYLPVSNPPANRMGYLVRCLVGTYGVDRVRVVTGRPNFPDGVLPREFRWRLYKRRIGDYGEKIDHLYELCAPFKGLYRKTLGLLSFAASVFVYVLFRRFSPGDVVLVTTGPVFPVYVLNILSRMKRNLRYVVDIRDLWPEVVAAMGFIDRKSLLYRSLSHLSDTSYRRAIAVTVNAEGWGDHVRKVAPDVPSILIYNPVNTDLFCPVDNETVQEWRCAHPDVFKPGRTTFLFAGLLSVYMDLMNLMQAISVLHSRTTDFTFIFIGFGEAKPKMQEYVEKNGLEDHVVFLPFMPREELLKYICSVDFGVSCRVDDPVYSDFVPVKMLEYMACNTFVVAAHRCRFTERAERNGHALVCEAGSPDALALNMQAVIDHPPNRPGATEPRQIILDEFSVKAFDRRFSSVVGDILENR